MKYRINILALVLLISTINSQPKISNIQNLEDEQNVFVNYYIFPICSNKLIDSFRVDLVFKISEDFLIYIIDSSRLFRASGELAIDIENIDKNLSVKNKIINFNLIRTQPPQSTPSFFESKIITFYLSPGRYRILIEVRDQNSYRKYSNDKLKFNLESQSDNSIAFSNLVFLEAFDTLNYTSIPLLNANFGNTIPFPKPFYGYIDYNLSSIHPDNIKIELKRINISKSSVLDYKIPFKLLDSLIISPVADSNYYRLQHDNKRSGLLIFIPSDKLTQDEYELNIISADNQHLVKEKFRIKWFDMPKVLRHIDIATDLLEYIASSEEFREIKTSNLPTQKEKFELFWKKHDPTPETEYNEAMAEYYYRADYAMENFSTIGGIPGAKTDRGKIHMLYGKPNNIERLLLPRTTPKEIWIYDRIKKKFTFEDKSKDGNYKLIKIEEL